MQTFYAKLMRGYDPLAVLVTLGLGAIGGWAGLVLGVPLGMLLGAMTTVAVLASTPLRIRGRRAGMPEAWRTPAIPVIGVAIGSSVPPEILSQALHWWPTVLAVFAFVPLAHWLSYVIYRKLGALDPVTSFFSAMPGGFIEAMEIGEERGADMRMLIILQFLRLILCIVMIPLSFSIATGHAVGSGSGVDVPGSAVPLQMRDIVILIAAGVLGYYGARALRLPAAQLSGPLFLSGLAHAAGVTEAAPPSELILLAQWLVGTALGSRFAGMPMGYLWLGARLAVVAILGSMALATGIALLLADVVREPVAAVILAFAPGGVSEMSLVAISLQMSAVYVSLHHMVRIVLAILVARAGLRWLPRQDEAPRA